MNSSPNIFPSWKAREEMLCFLCKNIRRQFFWNPLFGIIHHRVRFPSLFGKQWRRQISHLQRLPYNNYILWEFRLISWLTTFSVGQFFRYGGIGNRVGLIMFLHKKNIIICINWLRKGEMIKNLLCWYYPTNHEVET